MEGFEIAMAYVPWQRWRRTYDPHRALMSGTIFPELDKPFCAAGRCNR
ncbi:MAG: spore coat associated protein CotJA [Lachnospiraceae bacterium]|nr:spore coat associated protein CotJA [Lachnospiraceae bacterium]